MYDDAEIDLEGAELYADSSRGRYIPQFFAESVKRDCVAGVSEWCWRQLAAGPDGEHYWDAWAQVCDNATLTSPNGERYWLYQDGDLWLVPHKAETVWLHDRHERTTDNG